MVRLFHLVLLVILAHTSWAESLELRVRGPDVPGYHSSDSQRPGALIEILDLIADRAGWTLNWRALPAGNTLRLATDGRSDLVVGLAPDGALEAISGFPTLVQQEFLAVDRAITTIADLSGKSVGRLDGSWGPAFSASETYLPKGNRPVAALLDRLFRGELSAIALPTGSSEWALDADSSQKTMLFSLSVDLPNRPLGLALVRTSPNYAMLAEGFATWLPQLKAESRLAAIFDRYGLVVDGDVLRLRQTADLRPLAPLSEDYPPFNFTNSDGPDGLVVDLVQNLQARLGSSAPVVIGSWSSHYQRALREPGILLFSTTRTAEREDLFTWVGPVARLRKVMYAKSGEATPLVNLEAAKSAGLIATYPDDVDEQFLRRQGFTNLLSTADPADAVRKVMEGEAQLWLDSPMTSREVLIQAGYRPGDLEEVLTVANTDLYLAFSKGTDPQLVGAWRAAFNAAIADGTVADLYARWLPGEPIPGVTQPDGPQRGLALLTEQRPPMNYIHDGETTGFAVEVVRALQERMNDETPIQVVSWDQGYERLLKQPDVALFSTFRTRERDPLFQWVGPLVTARLGFYGRKGTGLRVRSLEDARRLKGIGTYHNDAKEQFLEDQGFTNLVSASDPTTNLRHLMSGWIDCVIDTDLSCAYTSLQAGIDPADLELLFQIKELSMYIAFSKDTDPELVAAWQGALQSIKDDGTFSAIQDKWVLSPGTRLIGSGSLESDRPELAPGASTRPALTILTEENPPVNFTRNDKLTGYAVEVVRSIQKRIGGQDGIEITNWKSGYEAALAGPRTVLFSTSRTEQREGLFKWAGPLYVNRWSLYARKDRDITITSLDDAKALTQIGTYGGDVIEQHLQGLGFTNLSSADSLIDNLKGLRDGTIDVIALTNLQLVGSAMQAGIDPGALEPIYTFNERKVAIAFSQDVPNEEVDEWQGALEALHRSGELRRIAAKWLPPAAYPDLELQTAPVIDSSGPEPMTDNPDTNPETPVVDENGGSRYYGWLLGVAGGLVGLIAILFLVRGFGGPNKGSSSP